MRYWISGDTVTDLIAVPRSAYGVAVLACGHVLTLRDGDLPWLRAVLMTPWAPEALYMSHRDLLCHAGAQPVVSLIVRAALP